MSKRADIDELFRQELGDLQHPFAENLWQKLDARLVPVRDARQQKEKRRRVAFWLFLLLLAGGGTTALLLQNTGSRKPSGIAQKTETSASSGNNTNNTVEKTITPDNPDTPQPNTAAKNEQPAAGKTEEKGYTIYPPLSALGEKNVNTDAGKLIRTTAKRNTSRIARNNKEEQLAEPPGTPVPLPARMKQRRVRTTPKPGDIKIIPDTETDPTVYTPPAEPPVNNPENKLATEKPVVAAVTPPANVPAAVQTQKTEKPSPSAIITEKKKVLTPAKSSLQLYAGGGANLSSPFRKPGVYGSVMLVKTIDDKRIFAGLKLADNKLDHQLISSSKQNQAAPDPDAVIQNLTILQLPFGYEFTLNAKRKTPSTFLQLGFEPAYITGLRTLFYDDNGIPGGPRTLVVNSPLMAKAINRFNLSFTAGIRKEIGGGRVGLSLTGGYSLIDITDKQYYNRTSTTNNLKYIQAGVQLRLHK